MDTNIELKNGEISVITENGTTLIMNVDTLLELTDKLTAREKTTGHVINNKSEKEEPEKDFSGYLNFLKEILDVKDEDVKDEEEEDTDSEDTDVEEQDECQEKVDGKDTEEDDEEDDESFSDVLNELFKDIINIVEEKQADDKCSEKCECHKSKCSKKQDKKIIAYRYKIPEHFDPDTYDFRDGILDYINVYDSPLQAAQTFNRVLGTNLTEENITNIADSWKVTGNMLHDEIIDEVKTGLSKDIKEYYEYLTGKKFPHKYIHLYTVAKNNNQGYLFMWAVPESDMEDATPLFGDEILDEFIPEDKD